MNYEPACLKCHTCGTPTENRNGEEYCPTCQKNQYPTNHGHSILNEDFSKCSGVGVNAMDLKRYQDGYGMFKPLTHQGEPYWYTPEGQEYLKEYYILEEAYRLGWINTEELWFYHDQLVHPKQDCQFSSHFEGLGGQV